MSNIGLFYSFNTKKTASNAKKVIAAFGDKYTIEEVNVEEATEDDFLKYDNLILGVPTWFDGELPNYWDEFLPAIEDAKFKKLKVAIFGLGDQIGYPENFCDGIGTMAKYLRERGATIIGLVPNKGYKFEYSAALEGDYFLGLPLDQENQGKMTQERIDTWVKQLQKEL